MIGKGQRHTGVLALVQPQVPVEHHGELGPSDILIGLEGTVRITGGDSGRVQVIHIGGSPIVFGV